MTRTTRRMAAGALAISVGAAVLLSGKVMQPEIPEQPEAIMQAAHPVPRSGKWPAVRNHYLEAHPTCEACGRTAKQSGQAIEVHHRVPFSVDGSKEIDPENLIALCRRCHELIGHLDSWRSFNPDVAEDADRLLKKIQKRP